MVYPGKKGWSQLLRVFINTWMLANLPVLFLGVYEIVQERAGAVVVLCTTWLLLFNGLWAWIVFSTTCEITGTSVIFHKGPIRLTVSLHKVDCVMPIKKGKGILGNLVGNLLLTADQNKWLKNFFLDLKDPAAFLRELTERQPGLEVQLDGSLRRRVSADVQE